jgi:ATP/maltotriose-dependent transcriptional regulator MalT
MSYSLNFLIAVVVGGTVTAGTLRAQETSPPRQRLADAFAMENAGQPEAAIIAAQSLIDSHTLARLDQAQALDLEGISYEDLDEPEKAVHALEEAGHLLGPQDHKERAAVLNNMARVYRAWGHYTIANYLYERALQQAEVVADHGDMARVANNEAGIALSEKKNRQARKYLDRADREAKQATDLDDDDLAATMSMHGWLAFNEGKMRAALESYRKALDLWTEKHGEQHFSTAWGMLLVGQTEAMAGERDAGLRMMRDGLALTAATVGEKSQRYAVAELVYARLLDRVGNTSEAAQLQQDAQTKLTIFDNRSCRDCTISAMALH